jgi:cell division protein ZapA (FtsZ GTPase activity inhibitor)
MPIVNIKILNTTHQIACEEGGQENLITLAAELNDVIEKLGIANHTNSELKILVLHSLIAQAKIKELEKNILLHTNKQETHIPQESVIKTLDTITTYIENLAKKIDSM